MSVLRPPSPDQIPPALAVGVWVWILVWCGVFGWWIRRKIHR